MLLVRTAKWQLLLQKGIRMRICRTHKVARQETRDLIQKVMSWVRVKLWRKVLVRQYPLRKKIKEILRKNNNNNNRMNKNNNSNSFLHCSRKLKKQQKNLFLLIIRILKKLFLSKTKKDALMYSIEARSS